MGLNPKAPTWTPGPRSSGDRRGDSLGRIRRAVHGVGTRKSGWSRNAGSRRAEPTREKRQAPG